MNITPKQVLTLAAKYIGYKEKASVHYYAVGKWK